MTFHLDQYWVWDLWIADDGVNFHMFYLHAPKTLKDPDLRHRNAQVGHAVSADLTTWVDRGVALSPGGTGEFDETATWTGSVVRGPDGLWRMFYTGARFLPDGQNIESIGVAVSADLDSWTKTDGPACEADSRWYELLGDTGWPEQAWRDPWVFRDPDGDGWHMLITARSNVGAVDERGVIGHAVSDDLAVWEVREPLSSPGAGFMHLEVPQTVQVDDRDVLVFSCDTPRLSAAHRAAGGRGGIWLVDTASLVGPFDVSSARLLQGEDVYAGRLVLNREGQLVLLGFEMAGPAGQFVGAISDPITVELQPPPVYERQENSSQ